ncbi:Intradiol ring-cleavage dioxygenase [Ganoderma leucocontextum]|nr:Intradiol ring-cleavage dioxygenase [Ganoderma leucocontextum]
MGRPTAPEWAAHKSVGLFTWLWFVLRTSFIMVVVDNPLSWKLGLRGDGNKFDDIEGPYFVQGAPVRQVGEGQAVLASKDFLNKWDPFLIVLEVKDTKGEPVRHAMIDSWQADGSGIYYFLSWTLRGKMMTDSNGRVELLTIRPGEYMNRASHNHLRIYPADNAHRKMTTQMYICDGNDPVIMDKDLVNMWRPRRDRNVMACWALEESKDGRTYHNLPKLPGDDVDMVDAINRWNTKLEEQGVNKKLMSVGHHQIQITAY